MNLSTNAGTYALVLKNETACSVQIGALGRLDLLPGFYLYVGSALGPGGLRARVSHHLRRAPRPRWHVDYLRYHVDVVAVWTGEHATPQEHVWAATLGGGRGVHPAMRRFGASDCRCESHLFFSQSYPSLKGFRARLARAKLPHAVFERRPTPTVDG